MYANKDYKSVPHTDKHVTNYNELNAVKFETRLPTLISQRYSYNDGYLSNGGDGDGDDRNKYPTLYDFAHLSDLPIDYKSPYHATIPADMLQCSLAYQLSKDQNIDLSKSVDLPEIELGINKYKYNVQPYDPLSILPENYADRSKTSIERLLAADLYKEYREPVHGYLPWDR